MTKGTAIILLAAGTSSRMGRPKQLLPFRGSTLIEYITSAAVASSLGSVIVVTGAAGEEVRKALKNHPVLVAVNKDWQQGMGASIACGIKSMTDHLPGCDRVILCVCDQPFVDANLFTRLAEQNEKSGSGIVASEYAGTIGTPVLFESKYFTLLSQLSGDTGAKAIVRANSGDVATVSFASGAKDVDTPADYTELLQTSAE